MASIADIYSINKFTMAERAGFEPAVEELAPTHDFQSCSFSHTRTPLLKGFSLLSMFCAKVKKIHFDTF